MSTISSGTTLTTALVQTGDTTGDLVIKTNNGNTTAVTFNTAGAIGVGSSPSYGSVGQYLQSAGNAAPATWATIPATNPGGATTQVQFNNAGAFGGSANLTFNGTTLTATDITDSSLTPGRVVFPTTGGNLTGSADLFWDSANARLGVGTASPQNQLHINGTTTGYARFQSSNRTYTIGSLASAFGFVINDVDSGQQVMQIDAAGLFKFNSGYGSVATAYGCRAWVNFNGTGTVAIRGSGNVTSITDNGTGDYTVNLTTAMPDTNYSPVTTLKPTSGASSTNGKVANIRYDTNLSTSSFRIWCNSTGGAEDMDIVSAAIFR